MEHQLVTFNVRMGGSAPSVCADLPSRAVPLSPLSMHSPEDPSDGQRVRSTYGAEQ